MKQSQDTTKETKLALEIPIHHWDELVEYTDFDYALIHLIDIYEYRIKFKEQALNGREVWLDNSYNELRDFEKISLYQILKSAEEINATHIVLPEATDPLENFNLITNSLNECSKLNLPYKLIVTWRGSQEELLELNNLRSDLLIALPYDLDRDKLTINSRDYHYFGFKSLNELRQKPPRSIDTSYPIRIAQLGLDLERVEGERVPLNYFNPLTILTKQELKLAIKNILTIRSSYETNIRS